MASFVDRNPTAVTLLKACQEARKEDKKIMMDFWGDSISTDSGVYIGIQKTPAQEKHLIKNEEEYTSPITRIVSSDPEHKEYLIITENSIYIVYFNNIKGSARNVDPLY